MTHHARLNANLFDLRNLALERARVLSGHADTKPIHPQLRLQQLDAEIALIKKEILTIAGDKELGGEEQTVIYALVSLLDLMAKTPFSSRIEHLVNDRFLAARYQINALRRARRRARRPNPTTSARGIDIVPSDAEERSMRA